MFTGTMKLVGEFTKWTCEHQLKRVDIQTEAKHLRSPEPERRRRSPSLPHIEVFHDFYTVLIFTDILRVLIAQRYMPEFHAIFRNSGFALSTLFFRMALTAETTLSVIVGVGAMVFAVCLTYASNHFYTITAKPGLPCPLHPSPR